MLAGCLVYGLGAGLFIRLATVSLVGFVLAFASYFVADAYGNLPPPEERGEPGTTPLDLIFGVPVLWAFIALGRTGRLLISAVRRPDGYELWAAARVGRLLVEVQFGSGRAERAVHRGLGRLA